MKALAVVLLVLLTGCSSLKESAHTATAVDAASTAFGVSSGLVVEANPLIGSPLAFAGVMAARVIGTEMADKMDEPARTEVLTTLNSLWWGVSVSNILILLTASNPVGLAAGAMVGLGWWASTDEQRRFAEICAQERASRPQIKCTYKAPQEAPFYWSEKISAPV